MSQPDQPPALQILEEIPVPGNQAQVEMRSRDMDVGVWFGDLRGDDEDYWLYFRRAWYFARVQTGYEEIAAADGWDGHLVEVVPPARQPPQGYGGAEIHHYLFELEGHGLFELLAEGWSSGRAEPDADADTAAEAESNSGPGFEPDSEPGADLEAEPDAGPNFGPGLDGAPGPDSAAPIHPAPATIGSPS